MRHIFFYKTMLFLLLTSPCFALQSNQDLILNSGLKEHIGQSRESFEAMYYQMVDKNHFPISYNNNLVINSTLQHDAQKEGIILIRLIEWLDRQDDQNSCLLLEKLNYLYFLELHSFLSRMNLKKDPGSAILALCQDLYHCTISIPYRDQQGVKDKTPFRSALSKLFLMISIINQNQIHHEERKETLAFALEGVKRDMLAVNQALGAQKIDNDIIKSFVTLLEIYAAREPMMESHNVRNIILFITFGTVAGYLIYRYRDKIGNVVSNFFNSLFNEFFEKSGEGLYKGMRKAADPDIAALTQSFADNKAELKADIMGQVNQANQTLAGLAVDANRVTTTLEAESPAWRNVAGQINTHLGQANQTLTGLAQDATQVNQTIAQESPAWRNTVQGVTDGVNNLRNGLERVHVPMFGPIVRPAAQPQPAQDDANPAVDNQGANNEQAPAWWSFTNLLNHGHI